MVLSKKARIKKACFLLSAFKKLGSDNCREIIQHFSDEGIEDISEIVFNSINPKFPMNKRKKTYIRKKLKPHAKHLIKLAKPPKSSRDVHKKRRLLQKGGGIILPLLAATIGPLIGKLISGSK